MMLPPGKLVGRDVVLARVYSQLKENKAVLVYGASGIGKTTLAATLASAYTELPGGVLWLDVNDTPLPELLARVGRAYGVREVATSDNPLNQVNVAMNALTAAKPMVVIDGTINPQATAEFVMRSSNRVPILILSDAEQQGPWTNIPLGNLETDAAATMFKHLAPEQTEGIDALMAALDNIPFAIAIAAGAMRANRQTAEQFLAALPKRPGIAPPLLTLTASFSSLTNPLQGLLLLMGATFRGEASTELISLIANQPEDSITQALNLLVQQHLVERFQRYGRPYYRLHPITFTFAQTWLRGSARLDGLQNRVRDAILAYAGRYSTSPERLAAEMENFLAAARWAADKGDRDVANRLTAGLMQASEFVTGRGYVYELLLLRRLGASSTSAFPAYTETPPTPVAEEEEAPEVESEVGDEDEELEDILDEAADEADDWEDEDESEFEPEAWVPPARAAVTDQDDEDEDEEEEASIVDDVLDFEEEGEEIEESEPISEPVITDELDRLRAELNRERAAGNRRQQAELLRQIGEEQVKRGQENEAIASYSDALNVYEALNDSGGLLATLETLASLTTRTDNSQAAVLHATRGVKLAEELGSDTRHSNLLVLLGDARQQLGESDEAIEAYTEALDLARTANDKRSIALVLYKLGFAQLDGGDSGTAIQSWEEALTLFREQGRRDYEGRTLAGLGTASGESGHWNEAIKFYTSALYIARELGDREEEMLRLSDLGYAAVQAHELGQAVLRYRQALHLAYESNNRENIVSTTVDLGRLLVESQRHLDITEMLVQAAMKFDPADRDLRRLMERIEDERPVVPENIKQAQVSGTAQDYAANAYSLLDSA
ncbi:MAG: ATP-binding protein [Anaerolineae bacterium]|nr:ATP-binding protein [Anaerolineae bacterium]